MYFRYKKDSIIDCMVAFFFCKELYIPASSNRWWNQIDNNKEKENRRIMTKKKRNFPSTKKKRNRWQSMSNQLNTVFLLNTHLWQLFFSPQFKINTQFSPLFSLKFHNFFFHNLKSTLTFRHFFLKHKSSLKVCF